MNRTVRNLALLTSGGVLLAFGVVVVNQTAQFVQFVGNVNPTLGTVTLWGLIAAYTTMLGVPAFMLLRLPAPLVPPASDSGPEFDEHLKALADRLKRSPHLAGQELSHRQGVEEAIDILNQRADAIIKEAAAGIFLTTAVSQSGRLDGLLVMVAQSRMVWRIAHLYQQRPSLREMTHLYANVAGTAFVAGQIEEMDLRDQVEPVLSAALGALGASVPGFQAAGTILATCVLDGSANAFLTLRVGIITRRYCAALVVEPKTAVRRAATAEAAGLLGGIVAEGSGRISKAIWKASVNKVGDAVSNATDRARDAGSRLVARMRGWGFGEQPGAGA